MRDTVTRSPLAVVNKSRPMRATLPVVIDGWEGRSLMSAQPLDRPLPHSADAERAILGSIILDNSLLAEARDELSPEDFYVRAHVHIFRAMVSMSERGAKIDPILIGEELKRDGMLEQVGGISFISELDYGLPRLSNISSYAKVVKDKSLKRQFVKVASLRVAEALEDGEDSETFLDGARRSLSRIGADAFSEPATHSPPELSPAALRGLAGDFVRLVEPHTEADPVALLVQTVVFFGNCVGRTAYFPVEADYHHTNLFAVVVGATGSGRKGTSLGHVKRLFEAVDDEWARERIIGGLASGEGLIDCVGDAVEVNKPVRDKGRATGEYESVLVSPGVTDKRALVVESEFARALRAQGREGNTLSAIIRQAWDGDTLRTLTVSSPRRATNAHISIIAHITAEELQLCLNSTERFNGYVNRFLWVYARRSKLLPEGGRAQDENYCEIVRALSEALGFARRTGSLARDDAARALWRDVYPDLSARPSGLFGALTARAAPQVIRLSVIYALLDQSKVVRRTHVESALALWKYCEDSVRYIFGERTGDRLADEILRALRSTGAKGLTRTEINNHLGGHRKREEIDGALSTLAEAGLATAEDEATGGRPSKRWLAVSCGAGKAEKAE